MTDELDIKSTDPPDYNVKVTVRNGRLLSRIRAAGNANVTEFCRVHSLPLHAVQALVNYRAPGMDKKSEWRNIVIQVADALECMPQDIIPPQHWNKGLVRNTFELPLTGDQAAQLVGSHDLPDSNLIREQMGETLIDVMHKQLRPREERVLRLRYGIDCERLTAEEIAVQYGVTKAQIWQIEQRALWKLRNPKRPAAKMLKPYLFDPAVTGE